MKGTIQLHQCYTDGCAHDHAVPFAVVARGGERHPIRPGDTLTIAGWKAPVEERGGQLGVRLQGAIAECWQPLSGLIGRSAGVE